MRSCSGTAGRGRANDNGHDSNGSNSNSKSGGDEGNSHGTCQDDNGRDSVDHGGRGNMAFVRGRMPNTWNSTGSLGD